MRLSTMGLATVLAVSAGARPTNTKPSRGNAVAGDPLRSRGAHGLVNMGYFTNWGPFQADDITTADLTHVLYAFAGCDNTTGGLLPLQSNDEGNVTSKEPTLGGQLGKLFELKKQNRSLKVLLSIGGWSYSQDGQFSFLADSTGTKRNKFINDTLAWLEDYGLDGIDIDYEALKPGERFGYENLMQELRVHLDEHAARKNDTPYLLTSAVDINPDVTMVQTEPYVDFFNVMGYDFASIVYSEVTGHQANLWDVPSQNDGMSVDTGITGWLAQNVPPHKIVLGQPLYAREFPGAKGLFAAFDNETLNDGGTVPYNANLSTSGPDLHILINEGEAGAAYFFNDSSGIFLSYDVPEVTRLKADYIIRKNLAGAMFWELSGDQKGDKSLVWNSADAFRKSGQLDDSPNHLYYPGSRFSNVRQAAAQPSGTLPLSTSSTQGVSSTSDSDTSTTTPSAASATQTVDSSTTAEPSMAAPLSAPASEPSTSVKPESPQALPAASTESSEAESAGTSTSSSGASILPMVTSSCPSE